jgi:tRNA pseudouridine55 synthase
MASIDLNGLLLVNKPRGMTSYDVIRNVKRLFREHGVSKKTKIGHGGTLDPEAEGLLVIGLGKHTKQLGQFINCGKEYDTVIDLRHFTTTDDVSGDVVEGSKNPDDNIPSLEMVKKVLSTFVGPIEQIPSKFSAIKIDGKRAYDLARKGVDFKMKTRSVTIEYIKIVSYSYPELEIQVGCSKGTYIRTLGKNIGEALGTGGFLSFLLRFTAGAYSLRKSYDLCEIEDFLISGCLQKKLTRVS